MNVVYQIKPTIEKRQEISQLLNDYWGNDVWYISNSFFDKLRPKKWDLRDRTIDFSTFCISIKDEVKYMYAYRLQQKEIRLHSVINYSPALKRLAEFFNEYYPSISSIIDIHYNKALLQLRSFLIGKGMRTNHDCKISNPKYESVLKQLFSFFTNLYDTRDEYEKDIWDCRKIPGAKITETIPKYYLDFTDIPSEFRKLVKNFIKVRTTNNSLSQCQADTMSLRLFTKHINIQEPLWKDLTMLTRKHMEDYLSWYRGYTNGWKGQHVKYIISLRIFLDYIQRAMYPEAPEIPSVCLLLKDDIPRMPQKTENAIKYIPEGVIQQLEDNLEHLTPSDYIPIVILLRASGWRISDILNLRYDTCLERTSQGWYLCGDIPKMQVLNHHIPITDEVCAIVQSVINEVKVKSTNDNNPNNLLFVRYDGKRKGHCPQSGLIQKALNRLSKIKNIIDEQGNIFHFGNHAFRHTKAVELINGGMNILHVQKWMAHASPEMTLCYAKILDTTMRKSWEEATQQGLFRVDASGKIKKIDISDNQNDDIIEWEYIRHNLDAVRMPLGYCMKPKKQECYTQLNPCLTCRNLCTTPDFIPQYKVEIQETKALIERGKKHGQSIWVEKNMSLLERYEEILSILDEGKIHHKAGKKGREYVGEERINAKQP